MTLRGVGSIAFWHAQFREYLAARQLADLPDARRWDIATQMLFTESGREVLPLLAGILAYSRERLNDVFVKLTAAALRRELPDQAHAVGILGRMLSDVEPAEYKLCAPADAQYAQLRAAVTAIFEKGAAAKIGVMTRVAAAEALDQASRERLPLPWQGDKYWVSIPGGTLTTGDDEKANRFAAEFLMPRREIKPALFGLTMSKLADLKQEWGVSMAAIVMHAHALGSITEAQKRYTFINIGRAGFRIREPIEIPIEKPT